MLAKKKNFIFLLIIFVSTLLIRCQQYYVYREFNSDKARQLHGAYNLLKKKGISYESYDLNTFKPLYTYVSDWPPAYSYIAAGISFITGVNLYVSSIIIDLLATTALWFILTWIMKLLNFTVVQQLLLFLFLSISKTVLTQFLSADLLGLAVFLLSCALCIKYIQQERNLKPGLLFYSLQLLIFLTLVFLKFSLIPAAAAPSLSMLFYSFVTTKKRYLKPGIILFVLFLVSLSLLYLYKESVSGDSVTYQRVMTEPVWHFDNLLLFNPFVASTFFYLTPLYLRYNNSLLNTIAVLLTLITIIVFLFYFFKNTRHRIVAYLDTLLLTTLLTVSGFLALVSVRFPKDDVGDYQWTFVMEYRYFAPVIILLLLFAYRHFKVRHHKNVFSTYFSFLVALSCLTTFALEGYYLLIHNQSTSFRNLYGKVFDVSDYVNGHNNENTYFIALTNHQPTDTEMTSLVALRGGKVVVSYSNYFPDSTYNTLFKQDRLITPGKKIVVYYGKNKSVLDKINMNNKHRMEHSDKGDAFLVIEN